MVGVTTSLVIGVIFDLECDSSSAVVSVCFIRRLCRVVKPPVSKSRSKRWPERERVSCRCTYSSKSSSSRLLIKQFRTIKKTPRITANRPVATNSFHQVVGLPIFVLFAVNVIKGNGVKRWKWKRTKIDWIHQKRCALHLIYGFVCLINGNL